MRRRRFSVNLREKTMTFSLKKNVELFVQQDISKQIILIAY